MASDDKRTQGARVSTTMMWVQPPVALTIFLDIPIKCDIVYNAAILTSEYI